MAFVGFVDSGYTEVKGCRKKRARAAEEEKRKINSISAVKRINKKVIIVMVNATHAHVTDMISSL